MLFLIRGFTGEHEEELENLTVHPDFRSDIQAFDRAQTVGKIFTEKATNWYGFLL